MQTGWTEQALEALAEAGGQIIADLRKGWRKELEFVQSESRAILAELKADNERLRSENAALGVELRQSLESALSKVRDGVDGVDGQDGAPGKDGADGLPGAPGPQGDRGEKGDPGEPGQDGTPGRDGLPGIPGRDGKDGLNGKDGAPGKDGVDGLGFDDLSFDLEDGGRTILLSWTRGDLRREIRKTTTVVVYRGVFKEGQEYLPGDTVTRQGSTWHCNKPTKETPGTGCKDWTLTVKRGSDGKDGARGEKGEKGDPGRNGRDLTQLGHDGTKWG